MHSVVSPPYLPVLEALPAKAYCSLPATPSVAEYPRFRCRRPCPHDLRRSPHSSPPTVDRPSLPSTDLHCIQSATVDIFIAPIQRHYAKLSSHSEHSLRVQRAISLPLHRVEQSPPPPSSSSRFPTPSPRSATRRSPSPRRSSMLLAPHALVCLCPA